MTQGVLAQTIRAIAGQDPVWRERAKARLDQLTMPHWALGRLMDLAMDLAGQTRSLRPATARKTVVVMAGDHGVTEEGVSLFPREVTPQMVANFVAGGAGINALARQANAGILVVDLGVDADLSAFVASGSVWDRKIGRGTANLARGPAMSREQATAAIEAGIGVATELAERVDIFGTGDMGIGNTTPSAAIASVLAGVSPTEVAGRGTGLDDAQLRRKIEVIERAIAINAPRRDDPLGVLASVGGFEIGGIAGVILGAAARRKPVVVDGFISTAGAMVACVLAPLARDYVILAHRSMEQGHRVMIEHLGLTPLLDLGLRLGEGTGAALAMNVVEAAARVLTDVATFEEARVSGAEAA